MKCSPPILCRQTPSPTPNKGKTGQQPPRSRSLRPRSTPKRARLCLIVPNQASIVLKRVKTRYFFAAQPCRDRRSLATFRGNATVPVAPVGVPPTESLNRNWPARRASPPAHRQSFGLIWPLTGGGREGHGNESFKCARQFRPAPGGEEVRIFDRNKT